MHPWPSVRTQHIPVALSVVVIIERHQFWGGELWYKLACATAFCQFSVWSSAISAVWMGKFVGSVCGHALSGVVTGTFAVLARNTQFARAHASPDMRVVGVGRGCMTSTGRDMEHESDLVSRHRFDHPGCSGPGTLHLRVVFACCSSQTGLVRGARFLALALPQSLMPSE